MEGGQYLGDGKPTWKHVGLDFCFVARWYQGMARFGVAGALENLLSQMGLHERSSVASSGLVGVGGYMEMELGLGSRLDPL